MSQRNPLNRYRKQADESAEAQAPMSASQQASTPTPPQVSESTPPQADMPISPQVSESAGKQDTKPTKSYRLDREHSKQFAAWAIMHDLTESEATRLAHLLFMEWYATLGDWIKQQEATP